MSVIADGPLYWKSAMIDALSLSSCESEIRAINMAKEPIKEILKLKNWMTDVENALALTSSPNSHSILTDVPLKSWKIIRLALIGPSIQRIPRNLGTWNVI